MTDLGTAAETILQVKAQPLTAEAFAPYGSILDLDTQLHPEKDDGRWVMVKARLPRMPGRQVVDKLANHFAYNQQFLILKGLWVMVVAPAPAKADAPRTEQDVDYDRIAAFLMEPGDCLEVDRGVWHNGFSLTEEVVQMTLTLVREKAPGREPVTDFLDIRRRDRRVVEVVL